MPPEAAATATTATATETSTTATASGPWYSGKITDAADIGYLQNKGWHDKPANDVALEMYKSYRGLEKLHGVPHERIVAWPKDAGDEAGWNTVREKLGVPKEASAYDFKDIKFPDNSDLDENFTNMLRQTAFKHHLSVDAAKGVAAEMVKFMGDAEKAASDQAAASKAAAIADLKKNWGANYDANLFIAKQAAKKFGVTDDEINNFENINPRSLEVWRKIGQAMGEDRYITSETGRNPGGVMTREQAVQRWNMLKTDQAWMSKYNSGDVSARQEFEALARLMTPGA